MNARFQSVQLNSTPWTSLIVPPVTIVSIIFLKNKTKQNNSNLNEVEPWQISEKATKSWEQTKILLRQVHFPKASIHPQYTGCGHIISKSMYCFSPLPRFQSRPVSCSWQKQVLAGLSINEILDVAAFLKSGASPLRFVSWNSVWHSEYQHHNEINEMFNTVWQNVTRAYRSRKNRRKS